MAHTHHRFSPDTVDGCLTHSRFRPPDTGEWGQGTCVQRASVEPVCRDCRDAVERPGSVVRPV
jgi:hypothetical protein